MKEKKTRKINYSKLRLALICTLSIIFLALLPLIFYAIYKISDGSVWLGFWASYVGGLCTLIAVVITIIFESQSRKKENKKLSQQLAQQFERDLDLRRIEKFEDSIIDFKIFMLKINPKFEESNGKIIFNYNQIKDDMYEKYSIFKQYYYNINSHMSHDLKRYFQDLIKNYIGYLDTLKQRDYLSIAEATAFAEKINDEYKIAHAKKNKHGFINLRNDIIEFVQIKYSGLDN